MTQPPNHGPHTPADTWRQLAKLLASERRDVGTILAFALGVGLLSVVTPAAIEALVNTVAFGVLLWPVIVRWDAPLDRFVIVDGKRRWRAAQRTKTTTALSAIVDNRHMTPDQLLEMQLVTNALRDDVPPMEAATAYRMLMGIWGLNQNQLAARLHISAAKVSRALALLDLLAEVQVAVEEGKVGASVAVRAARKKPASKSKKPNTVRLSCDAGTAVVTVKPGKTVGDFLAALIEQERRRAA